MRYADRPKDVSQVQPRGHSVHHDVALRRQSNPRDGICQLLCAGLACKRAGEVLHFTLAKAFLTYGRLSSGDGICKLLRAGLTQERTGEVLHFTLAEAILGYGRLSGGDGIC